MTHKQPIKAFTSFSGYDSQCMALDRLGVDYDLVGWSEIDKYAIQAHDLLFPQFAGRNFGDIREIDWEKVPDFDLFTMSSPCQDFSNAGLQQGGEEGSGTRSSLLWECRRAIVEKRPKYIVFENVKGLVSQKFLPYFLKWQEELSGLGYTNFAQVLNAKDYGVAQNRERVFMVSILGGGWYNFPQKQRLTKCLADYLEDEVAEKYYLSIKGIKYISKRIGKYVQINGDIATCLTAKGQTNWTGDFISKSAWEQNNVVSCAIPNSKGKVHQQDLIQHSSGLCRAIPAGTHGSTPHLLKTMLDNDRIRRLTPRECFRLMDVLDSDFDKLNGISDTQLYKMAGNSIVTACLVGIFKNLLNQCQPTTTPPVRAHFAPANTPAITF